jgi:hypothetical protein
MHANKVERRVAWLMVAVIAGEIALGFVLLPMLYAVGMAAVTVVAALMFFGALAATVGRPFFAAWPVLLRFLTGAKTR